MPERKTMAQRRQTFFEALEDMRINFDKAAYLQGCRAAAPEKHDTDDVRSRETWAYNKAVGAQAEAIRQFNAAVRAARRPDA